jgi:hypothetical protein
MTRGVAAMRVQAAAPEFNSGTVGGIGCVLITTYILSRTYAEVIEPQPAQ